VTLAATGSYTLSGIEGEPKTSPKENTNITIFFTAIPTCVTLKFII